MTGRGCATRSRRAGSGTSSTGCATSGRASASGCGAGWPIRRSTRSCCAAGRRGPFTTTPTTRSCCRRVRSRRSIIRARTAGSPSTGCRRSSSRTQITRKTSRRTCACATPKKRSRSIIESMIRRNSAIVRRGCTRSSPKPRPANRASRSTRRTACTARRATSRTRSKTLIGLYPRAAVDRTIRTCKEEGRLKDQKIRAATASAGPLRPALLSVAFILGLVGAALPVMAKPAASKPPALSSARVYGDYLAGRQAQHRRDFANAAKFYEKALAVDPDSPELISRTFLMEVFTGNFERAGALAPRELKLDPNDAVADLVTVVDRLKSGDPAGAVKTAASLPSDGVHRFVAPFALAWTRMATGDLAGAETALQGLDKFNGFEPLKVFQLGLLYDFAGKPDKAREFYDKAIGTNEQLNWRVTEIVANFEGRQGRSEQAQALYDRFLRQNSSSDLATAVAAIRAGGPPKPPIGSPADGLAAAMFDLASVLNQPETVDLALLYDRVALGLRPQFPLAQLLLSDILSAQKKPEESLAVLRDIPKHSPYYWSAQLRAAVNLDTLDRTEEAIAQLRTMAAQNPNSIGALVTVGDILRTKKRFAEAADAYDEAIK